ncbi:sensor histidine kinase [Acidovorax radicis]|uniref:sensor histidine kinase n=1 Tax=Acidovorax radicis TaxID=758826 RepID=UPI001CF99AE5|nr:ATP-binding protein [Acidovorax radicis]UCV01229.1 ATP-binding protein [Acidovorax radicis]
MFEKRNRRLLLVGLAIWCLQLFLTVYVLQHILHESPAYLIALQVILLVTLFFRGRAMLRPFLGAFFRDRRYRQRASPEVVAERQRIARDLHDGVGLQLTAAMALLDAQNPRELRTLQELQMCLLSLRLAVDSISSSNDPLTLRLACLRHRIEPVLTLRNIGLVWNIQPPDGLPVPCGATASEIVFILQEAFSNVLHHAQATEVTVTMVHEVNRGVWCIEVRDNGIGLSKGTDAAESSPGYGLKTMRERALRAGLFLAQETPEGGGTRVRLEAGGYWSFDFADRLVI